MSFAPGDIKWPMKSCENSVMGELCLWLPERTAVIVSHLHPFFDLFFVILKHFASFLFPLITSFLLLIFQGDTQD